MGAMLWYHDVPWRSDPAEALRAFQLELFQQRYNFAEEFSRHANSTRDGLRTERESGDRYGLVEIYADAVKVIDEVESGPLPTEPLEQIGMLRRLIATVTPDGFGNVLDVTSVDAQGGTHVTRRLRPDDVQRLVGSKLPTLQQARAAVNQIAMHMGRSESVCFEFYAAGTEQPAGWFFIGYTHD